MKHFLISIIALATLISCGGAEERKEVYLEKARQSLAAGNLDKARIELRNVLQIDPKEAQAHFQLGEIFDLKQEYQKAFSNYSKAAELDPENLEYHAKIGTYLLILAGDIDAAIEKRELILTKDPANVNGLLLKAGILIRQNDTDSAKKIAQNIFSKQPEHVHNAMFLSSIYLREGNYEETINVLNACIKENPNDSTLAITLATTYSKAGKYDLAEIEHKKILDRNPDVFSNYINLAKFYKANENYDKAEAVLKTAIENDTKDVKRKIALIEYIQQIRGNQIAIDELKNLIANNKNMGELRLMLAKLYLTENNQIDAENALKTTVDDFSEDSVGIKSRVYLANLYMQKENVDAATAVIDDALKISPNDSEVNFIKAKLHLFNKKYDEAITSLRIVIKDNPENIDAYFLLSSAHTAVGENEQASDVIERAYENNRTDAKSLLALANYHAKNKNAAKLEKIVDNYLAIDANNYEMLSYKASLLNERKMFSEAKVYALKMIELHSGLEGGYIQSVPSMMASNRKNDAISVLEDGYSRVKENNRILELLVSLYASDKNFDAAENKVQESIRKNGETSELYLLLAKVQWLSGKRATVEEILRKAIAIKPDWNEPYFLLANVYVTDKSTQKAIDALQQGLNQITGDLKLVFKLAEIYESLGDFNAAINVYEKAHEKNSDNIILTNNLAALLSEHRNDESSLKRAKELADKLRKVDSAVILDTVGWVYYKAGDYAEAVTILKNVVEKSPEVPVFNYHLGMALYKAGDEVSAKTYLTNSLASNASFQGRADAEALLKKLQ